MVELYDEFFSMLRFSKSLYDNDMAECLVNRFGGYPLDGDLYWELTYETIGWVFQDTRHYYNDRNELETWLFTDPVIDRFCQLCEEYEKRGGIGEGENPYRKVLEETIREYFTFSYSYGYGYDWRLSKEDRGRKCLLLFTGCEFYNQDEIFDGLIEIKYSFEETIKKLEQEFCQETRIIPLSLVTAAQWKEAA